MVSGLLLAALALGLAGLPHCGAMCAAPCMAASRPCAATAPTAASAVGLQIGRLGGYAILGVLAASSVGFARLAASHVDALRPLWLMLQLGLLVCGVWLLASGSVPRWMDRLTPAAAWPARWAQRLAGGRRPWHAPLRSALVGLAWALLPCAQLYAAVLIAALAPDAWSGAAVMIAFALPAAAMFMGLPAIWAWWTARQSGGTPGTKPVHVVRSGVVEAERRPWQLRLARWTTAPNFPVRLAGAVLAVSAGAMIVHAAVRPVAAWC